MTDTRAAFEAWADKRGLYLSDRGMYWEGWQAAINHERSECAKVCATADELEALQAAIDTLDDRGAYWEAMRLRELQFRLPPPPVDYRPARDATEAPRSPGIER